MTLVQPFAHCVPLQERHIYSDPGTSMVSPPGRILARNLLRFTVGRPPSPVVKADAGRSSTPSSKLGKYYTQLSARVRGPSRSCWRPGFPSFLWEYVPFDDESLRDCPNLLTPTLTLITRDTRCLWREVQSAYDANEPCRLVLERIDGLVRFLCKVSLVVAEDQGC